MNFDRTARADRDNSLKERLAQVPAYLSTDTHLAAEAALMAGAKLMTIGRQELEVTSKAACDFVTVADRDLDAMVRRFLSIVEPSDKIISEESGGPNTAVSMSAATIFWPGLSPSGRVWIVDPLDATTAYIVGAPRYTSIMVALSCDGVLTNCAIYAPFRDELYVAERGMGAFVFGRRVENNGPCTPLSEAHVAMNQYSNAEFETSEFHRLGKALRSGRGARLVTVPPPSSLLGCLAMLGSEQGIEAVIHDNNQLSVKQALWDIAAPKLFVEEAGGVYWDLGGRTWDCWAAPLGPILIARTASLGREILDLYSREYGISGS